MEPDFWRNKWDKDEIFFHREDVNPDLRRLFPATTSAKVFVPLCGKSLDLKWLAEQGHQVVGSELSEKACHSFFEENEIAFEKSSQEGFEVFKSPNIELWSGDFFKLPPSILETSYDYVYDRAALIALPHEMRVRYSTIIKNLYRHNPDLVTFLITLSYGNDTQADGPPFSVSDTQVSETLYQGHNIEIIRRQDIPSDELPDKLGKYEVEKFVFLIRS